MKSEHINELATALAKAQSEIKSAKKDANNPFFNSKYADLASVMDACRDALAKNGLSVSQYYEGQPSHLITLLMHSSGQWIEGSVPIVPVKQDPQGFVAATTYMRRASLAAMVGVVSELDDDGNDASGKTLAAKPRPPGSPTMPKASIVWKAGEKEREMVKDLATTHKWSNNDIAACIYDVYGKELVSDLTQTEFKELCEAIKTTHPNLKK